MTQNGNSKLIAALIKAQAEMQPAKKTGYNPFTKSNYSKLEDVYVAVKDALANNDLSYSHTFKRVDGETYIVTALLHVSGESIVSEMPLITAKNTPQDIGTAITYYKRYMLQAILGLPSEDDDGHSSSHGEDKPAKPAKPPKYISQKQSKELLEKIPSTEVLDRIYKKYNIDDLKKLEDIYFDRVSKGLDDLTQELKHA